MEDITRDCSSGSNGLASVASSDGVGTVNNKNYYETISTSNQFSFGEIGNRGYQKRIQYINYDGVGVNGTTDAGSASNTIISDANIANIYKSYISSKSSGVTAGTLIFIRYIICFCTSGCIYGLGYLVVTRLNDSDVDT